MSNFKSLKLSCFLMSANAFSSDSLDVSLGKASSTAEGFEARILLITEEREEGLRARRAMARLPCWGEERMRAIPVP
jgi:hypothetical protein